MFEQFHRIGSGCGIEIQGADLKAVAVKSRRAGLEILGETRIEDFRNRPAAEWGREYADFLTSCGMSHVSATVALPRQDVIVRQIQLPPMNEKERAAAVRYQLDGLHPFGEDEIVHAYSVLDPEAKGAAPVAVVIAEASSVSRYADLFEEAGIAVAAFTVTASALRAALRLRTDRIETPVMVVNRAGDELQIYGQSEGRAAMSAEFDLGAVTADRALQLAEADLRLERGETASLILAGEGVEVDPSAALAQTSAGELFPVPVAAPSGFDLSTDLQAMSTAIESACPRLGWSANLLPDERRRTDSRLMWAPTAVLAGLLVVLGVGFLVRPMIQNRAYASQIEQRLNELENVVSSTEQNREATAELRRRVAVLEGLSGRTTQDLRILSEISTLLPRSAWLQAMTITDASILISGETRNAAPLLGVLGQANTVESFAFATSLVRREGVERFEIAAERGPVGALPNTEAELPVGADETASEEAAAAAEEEPPGDDVELSAADEEEETP